MYLCMYSQYVRMFDKYSNELGERVDYSIIVIVFIGRNFLQEKFMNAGLETTSVAISQIQI